MSRHPNLKFPFAGGMSDAAGAYQIMYETEQGLIKQLVSYGMSEADATMFDKPTQNLKCVLLFSNHNCCQRIMDGDFNYGIATLNKTWASLPGSPYGQPVKTIAQATEYYKMAGGIITA
jgi:lysozyme